MRAASRSCPAPPSAAVCVRVASAAAAAAGLGAGLDPWSAHASRHAHQLSGRQEARVQGGQPLRKQLTGLVIRLPKHFGLELHQRLTVK